MRRIILILPMFLLAPVGAHAQSVLVLVVQPSDRAPVALELAEQVTLLGPNRRAGAEVAANPLDHQARFDFALALLRRSQRSSASCSSTPVIDVLRHLYETPLPSPRGAVSSFSACSTAACKR